ncbi:MAG TPA: (d)CMP kinase [Pseudobdellovibrionaceae bacterium]|nr:(d)CMP kinase [Pseudobdellovibrionaceae bacterium]
MKKIITIDGPAASGKTSVSRELSKRLGTGWEWVSTGAFYRGLAYVASELNYDLNHEENLAKLALDPVWEVRSSLESTHVFFKNQDVTREISRDDMGSKASQVSFHQKVREALLSGQRRCAEGKEGLIAEGRDCGTVVFPEAFAKIYITASHENRATRRAQELGMSKDLTLESQKQRDHQDTHRTVAPLQIPEGALVIDSTELSLFEVVDAAESFVRQKLQTL